MARWARFCAAALLCAAPLSAQPRLDAERILAQRFGNDAAWYRNNIPLFESADRDLNDVYYYRWQIVRAHQRDLGEDGYVTTEFLDDVPWQKHPFASLNDASGFHIAEARWLRNRRYAADYIDYMYRGGNDRHFTDYMADSVWGRYLVDGDRDEAVRHLSAMRLLFGQWDDKFDFDKGLYWVEPLLDATEYTISSIDASGGKDGFRGGDAFRPSVNAYMFANARAIGRLSALAGEADLAHRYTARADAIRSHTLRDLWHPQFKHFTDRYKVSNEHVRYWDFIRGRELVGFVPWMFDLPPNEARYAAAWRGVIDPARFAGAAGLRTVEPSYQYYMRQYRYEGTARECQWNGPIWPFQVTQVLAGMINLLDHYDQREVTRGDFLRLLRQYARLHRNGGKLDLEEDYEPESGRPIVGLPRSHHYFHSGFNDLVLTGVVGLRPRADDVLEVNPLLPTARDKQALKWFRAENIPYHGRSVAVTWDLDGRRYEQGRGLTVAVDGKVVARRAMLGRITVPIERAAPIPIARPINRAMQLVRGQYPLPTASSGTDPEALHDAIDGRTWFFPELPNGWTSDEKPEQWFTVDFGKPITLRRAELAFFADDAIAPPERLQVLGWDGRKWIDVAAVGQPVANGITDVRWQPQSMAQLRITMRVTTGKRIRLVELKAFL